MKIKICVSVICKLQNISVTKKTTRKKSCSLSKAAERITGKEAKMDLRVAGTGELQDTFSVTETSMITKAALCN